MLSKFIISSMLAALSAAQSPTITWVDAEVTEYGLADSGDYEWAGSVVDACPGTTVVALQCTAGSGAEASSACTSGAPAATLTIGPNYYEYVTSTKSNGVQLAVSASCAASGTGYLSCDNSASASAKGQNTATHTTDIYTGASVTTKSAVITAGAEKLNSTTCTSDGNAIGEGKALASMGALGFASLIAVLLL